MIEEQSAIIEATSINGITASTQSGPANLNYAFSIPKERLEETLRVHLDGRSTESYHTVVPLRDVEIIEHIALFKQDVLEALVRNISLRYSNPAIYPFREAEIQQLRIEPKGLYVGQTFVLEQKILSIMKNLQGRFSSHCTPGISKMGPAQIYGVSKSGDLVMAFYIPPIVEKHDNRDIILDGMHRSYICDKSGTTITAIHVSNISSPIPFDPFTWKDVKAVTEKPPIHERYKNLQTTLFRDLSVVGIDG